MHGLVHRTLKQYVVEQTDESSWTAVRERAGVEETLYLPVTRYDDAEFDAILEALATMSGHDRAAVERDVGRYLAEPLLETYRSHIRAEWDLETLLVSIEGISADLRAERSETDPPELSCTSIEDGVRIAYRSDRDYRPLARGILEGVVAASDDPATVEPIAVDDSAEKARAFRVVFDRE